MQLLLYREPFGLPLRWQDEQSGLLPGAVMAYLDHSIDKSKPLTETQLALVIEWVRHYINAPCWINSAVRSGSEDVVAEMRSLIVKSAQLQTAEDIDGWIHDCLQAGIDPL
jgi:hypothetical protein